MSKSSNRVILGCMLALAFIGYFLYSHAGNYTFNSAAHFKDIILAKGWTLLWLLVSVGLIFRSRKREYLPKLVVALLSTYFLILYGILFLGTEYGMHGHWGDNGNRLAFICKMMAFNTVFTDWRLKDLPAFYPPGWFAIMALWGKILGLQAYQTIKFGYLFVFLVYPWLLYWSWKHIAGPIAAAAVSVTTIYFGYGLLDWISYEHMTAALFMPWWLYYFEADDDQISHGLRNGWKFYLTGSVIGAGLFMTYYYWFFMAAAVLPVTLLQTYHNTRSLKKLAVQLKHKTILMTGVALISSIYWLPLLISLVRQGSLSAQNQWFGLRHTNLSGRWQTVSLESILIVSGLAMLYYLWKKHKTGRLAYLFLGGLILILIDRGLNLTASSIQTRKLLEFVHVFAMAPLAVGLYMIWSKIKHHQEIARGLVGLGLVITLLFANAHVENLDQTKYKRGLNQNVPEASLKALSFVDTDGTVFLTHDYLDACYLPYYQFIVIANMSAHTAGQYDERVDFLKLAASVNEPDLLAFALTNNRYDRVDYVYLPLDKETGRWKLTLQQVEFNKSAVPLEIIFSVNPEQLSSQFILRHAWGIWEIVMTDQSDSTRDQLIASYPELEAHLVIEN